MPSKFVSHLGTKSKWSGVNTPYGYTFVDNVNKKICFFTDSVEEISDKGMLNYFNFIYNFQEKSIDNPAYLGGIHSGYDPEYKRFFLTNVINNIVNTSITCVLSKVFTIKL